MTEREASPWVMGMVFFVTYLIVSLGVAWFRGGLSAAVDQLASSVLVGALAAVVFALVIRWWRDRQAGNPGSKGPR